MIVIPARNRIRRNFRPRRPGATLAVILALMSGTPAARAADQPQRCIEAARSLAAAIAGSRYEAIESAASAYAHQYGCDDVEGEWRRRIASDRLTSLALADSKNGADDERTRTRLRAARGISPTWRTLLALADTAFAARDFANATRLYQQVLNDMAEPHASEDPVPAEQRAFAWQRANETQMLAPDAIAPLTRGGAAGGLDLALAADDRGVVVTPRFLPVTFVFDSVEMTEQGRAYAEHWLESIRGAGELTLVMTGHADPRGTDARNESLSFDRAKSLAAFLIARGFRGTIRPFGFGRRCPVVFSDGANYTLEQQYQIMRRVEVVAGTQLPPHYCRGQPPVGDEARR